MLTAAQQRMLVRLTWAIFWLISAEIAAVVVLAGLGPWVAVAVLLAYGEIQRRWRPFGRVSTKVFAWSVLAQILGLAAAIIVLVFG